jgi:hypothetical protein
MEDNMMVIVVVLEILFVEATTVRSLETIIILRTIAVRNLLFKYPIKTFLRIMDRMDGLPGKTARVARHVELELLPKPDFA